MLDSTAPQPSLYDESFYLAHRDIGYRAATAVVPILVEMLRPASVVDVGCASGAWLSAFRENGVEDYLGIDSSWVNLDSLVIPQDRFLRHNLDEPLTLGRQFDLVVSLEVAEHLPPSAAMSFVHTLTQLGPVVVFSAAIPHQGGVCHFNEQWPEYWAGLFAHFGFVPVDCIRPRIWSDPDVAWWYSQNTLLYARPEVIGRLGLQPAADVAEAHFSMVRREMYLKILEKYLAARETADLRQVPLRKLLRALPGALFRTVRRLLSRRITPSRPASCLIQAPRYRS